MQWVEALSRPCYKDVVIESLKYCQEEKGLIVYAYVIMDNHVHMIAAAKENHNLSDILRDLKKFTSKKLLKEIESNPQESRKNWMLWLFKSSGERNFNNQIYQFWQQDNHPVELSTAKMIEERLDYLHNNPVKAGIVYEPEYYIYSSAIDYVGGKGILKVKFIV